MRLTRRVFLSALAVPGWVGAAELPVFPPEWWRYSDAATEWEVYRLTNPEHVSHLPAWYNRTLSRRGTFLLYWSDRTGSVQAFRMDLRTGESLQLTEAGALDGESLTLMPNDRSFCYFAGGVLRQRNIHNLREREIGRLSEGWERCPGSSVSRDGLYAVFGESRNGQSRLRLLGIASRSQATVGEFPFVLSHPQANPRRAQVLYGQGAEALWVVNFDGRQNRKLRTAPGTLGPAVWAPDGRTVLYLRFPEEKTRLYEIREHTPDENADKLIAPTSQFVHFGVNSDASVFAGASKNVNSPHVLILLRVTRRELTVCEHHASDPRQVAPIFSPDNRFIFFESDKDGKMAIYRVRVERFVEPAEDET